MRKVVEKKGNLYYARVYDNQGRLLESIAEGSLAKAKIALQRIKVR